MRRWISNIGEDISARLTVVVILAAAYISACDSSDSKTQFEEPSSTERTPDGKDADASRSVNSKATKDNPESVTGIRVNDPLRNEGAAGSPGDAQNAGPMNGAAGTETGFGVNDADGTWDKDSGGSEVDASLDARSDEGAEEPECVDGVIAVGEWESCNGFSNTCDETGTRSRTNQVCVNGRVTSQSESDSCTRDTDGTVVSTGVWGACGSFSDACGGIGTRLRTNRVCSNGAETSQSESESCTREVGGGTTVSGVQNGVTWTSASSPYRVTDDVLAANLTIEPGVCVWFEEATGLEVAGQLQAQGSAEEPIVFTGASWQGIFFNGSQPSTLGHCVVEGSVNSGVRVTDASPLIHDCLIQDNEAVSGGGIRVESGSPIIVSSRIEGNTGTDSFRAGGGIYVGDGCVSVTNTIIANNESVWANARGGGIHICGGSILIANSTIVDNGGTVYGAGSGGIAVNAGGLSGCSDNGTAFITSSIVYGNVGNQIVGSSSSTTIEYSNIQDGFSGTGNTSGNPIFSDTDYHLLDGASACIDAGDPDASRNDVCLPPSLGSARNDMGAWGGPGACGGGTGVLVCKEAGMPSIITSFRSPGSRCEGLAWDGEHLWMLDNLYEVYELDTLGNVVSHFTYDGWPQDLEWDGSGLWLGTGSGLVKVDSTGTEIDRRDGLYYWPKSGFAWDGEAFWVGDYNFGTIYKHAADGTLLLNWEADFFGHPTGMSSDGESLWMAGSGEGWENLFQYSFDGELLFSFDPSLIGIDADPGSFSCVAWDGEAIWYSPDSQFDVFRIAI